MVLSAALQASAMEARPDPQLCSSLCFLPAVLCGYTCYLFVNCVHLDWDLWVDRQNLFVD